jgi:phosphomannomutase
LARLPCPALLDLFEAAVPEESTASEYRCPGETYPISRAVHLGRLARFYPACRGCSRRGDHHPLSPRQARRLKEVERRAEPYRLFHPEGVAAIYWNQLTLPDACGLAKAMGLWLRQQPGHAEPPKALVAGDGRPLTPELVSAVVEGFRWAGCATVEIAAATSACTAMTVSHLACDGGILVGNPTGDAQTVGLKFFGPEGRPLSCGGALEAIEQLFRRGGDRPTRRFGSLNRFQAEVPYLTRLADDYHGLRPLRFVLATNCQPLERHLHSLLASTACQYANCATTSQGLLEQIRQQGAHFGLHVDDDGERSVVYDELGRAVAAERLAALVLGELLVEESEAVAVLDQTIAGRWMERFAGRLRSVACASASRAKMCRTMAEHSAVFGGNAEGRFWYRLGPTCWAADALQTLTLLLRHLSRSDQPLSAVLDGIEAGK